MPFSLSDDEQAIVDGNLALVEAATADADWFTERVALARVQQKLATRQILDFTETEVLMQNIKKKLNVNNVRYWTDETIPLSDDEQAIVDGDLALVDAAAAGQNWFTKSVDLARAQQIIYLFTYFSNLA
jgi:hypothetical protein